MRSALRPRDARAKGSEGALVITTRAMILPRCCESSTLRYGCAWRHRRASHVHAPRDAFKSALVVVLSLWRYSLPVDCTSRDSSAIEFGGGNTGRASLVRTRRGVAAHVDLVERKGACCSRLVVYMVLSRRLIASNPSGAPVSVIAARTRASERKTEDRIGGIEISPRSLLPRHLLTWPKKAFPACSQLPSAHA